MSRKRNHVSRFETVHLFSSYFCGGILRNLDSLLMIWLQNNAHWFWYFKIY